MHLPDLSGRTVLDIGAYDGFYSFEAERRGAARVLATDSWTWNWPGSDARRNFDLAHDVLESKVETRTCPSRSSRRRRSAGRSTSCSSSACCTTRPIRSGTCERVRSVTGGMAVVETVIDLLDVDVPAVAYYPGDS